MSCCFILLSCEMSLQGKILYVVVESSVVFKSVESRQVEEVVTSIFHTLLFHRSWGKVRSPQPISFVIVLLFPINCFFRFSSLITSKKEVIPLEPWDLKT